MHHLLSVGKEGFGGTWYIATGFGESAAVAVDQVAFRIPALFDGEM